jgi:hypothetical protein
MSDESYDLFMKSRLRLKCPFTRKANWLKSLKAMEIDKRDQCIRKGVDNLTREEAFEVFRHMDFLDGIDAYVLIDRYQVQAQVKYNGNVLWAECQKCQKWRNTYGVNYDGRAFRCLAVGWECSDPEESFE